jgi:CDP-diacylglycerol--inositol 3-phosphatidyltransferase
MKWVAIPIGLTGYFLEDLTWPQLTALSTFPIFAIKNVINMVQLWKASKILVGVDLAERAAEREARKQE